MRWAEFIAWREARRGWALARAARQLSADPLPWEALLTPWRCAAEPEMAGVIGRALLERLPAPGPARLSASLGDAGALPELPEAEQEGPAALLRQRVAERSRASLPETGLHRLAWALDAISFLGDEVERLERAAWREASYPEAPELDRELHREWRAWLSGEMWPLKRRWERRFLEPVRGVFRGVLRARRLPEAVQERAVVDLEEAFFFKLAAGSPPGWIELAVRVLETAGDGPVAALVALLSGRGEVRVSACAVRRGYWPQAASLLWPELRGAIERGRRFRARLEADPEFLERALDLHVLLRLLQSWQSDTAEDASWRRVRQNRGRARGRLRAALMEHPEGFSGPLLRLPSLSARTLAALKQYAWSWAWRELESELSFDLERAVTPPCQGAEPGLEPLPEEALPALRSWLLLAVLRGHLERLRRWADTGGDADHSAAWYRLLQDFLPPELKDPLAEGQRAATYHRLRAELSERLSEHLDALLPALSRVAALDPGRRGLPDTFAEALEGAWDPRVPLPRSRIPALIESARQVQGALLAGLEDPCAL